MTRRRPLNFDQIARHYTVLFAKDRLNDPGLIAWALSLGPANVAERSALYYLLDAKDADIRPPLKEAWHWVIEHWEKPDADESLDRVSLKRQFRRGDRPSELVRRVTDAVRPWLEVRKASSVDTFFGRNAPRRIRSVRDLFYASVSSGEVLKPGDIGLNQVEDVDFLKELAIALSAAIVSGLNLASTIGEITADHDSANAHVHRVYFVPPEEHAEGGGEPDNRSRGFAPAVKLLSAIVTRIIVIDVAAARRLVFSWDTDRWRMFRRLWAAAARDPRIASGEEVGDFLVGLSAEEFWLYHGYPEMAELRAVRWQDIPQSSRKRLERRLRRGRPASLIYFQGCEAEKQLARKRSAIVEYLRIKRAGGQLSVASDDWVTAEAAGLDEPPDVTTVTYGFDLGVYVIRGVPEPVRIPEEAADNLLALLRGAADADYWDDASKIARSLVVRDPGAVIAELTHANLGEGEAAKLWSLVAKSFRPREMDEGAADSPETIGAAEQFGRLIAGFDDAQVPTAIGSLTDWLSQWASKLSREIVVAAIRRLWPFAVAATDGEDLRGDSFENVATVSPMAELMQAFVALLPLDADPGALSGDQLLVPLLDDIAGLKGVSRMVAVYRMAESIGYFYFIEPKWASDHLLFPLRDAAGVEVQMWRGVAHAQYPGHEVLAQIGPSMVLAAHNVELDERVRALLVQMAVWTALLDSEHGREATIPEVQLQQMLRLGDDETRWNAVDAMKDYLGHEGGAGPERRFEVVADVFSAIWPKERLLQSRRTSDALASLPAAARARFPEATLLVAPYLTPFDCWSIWEYGIREADTEGQPLQGIDGPREAGAFLDLLDRTVGGEEGAIIPYDLDKALDHIASKSSKLEKDLRFRRLVTLARR